MTQAPRVVCMGGIFIDDIVYPDGRTDMEILGGGVTHAAVGVSVWDEEPGVFGHYGTGFPPHLWTRIARDFDTAGIIQVEHPQMRAWQLFEWDGKRTELYRVDVVEPFMVFPDMKYFPAAYREAEIHYLLCEPDDLRRWRQEFPDMTIFWEPQQRYMQPENAEAFRSLLAMPDFVSPNLLEAGLIYGKEDADYLIDAMLDDGAKAIALRMGELGSMVATKGERYTIKAVDIPKIIDQTGAGNTYCGGFLAGWVQTGDLRPAGCYGSVSASFTLEQVGVMDKPSDVASERKRRLESIL